MVDTFLLAQTIKETVTRSERSTPTPLLPSSEWFTDETGNGSSVSYSSICAHGEREYTDWKSVSSSFTYKNDSEEKLVEWVKDRTAQEIADLLDQTPEGCEDESGFLVPFTAWQRFCIAVHVRRPFSTSSSIEVPTEVVRSLANDSGTGRSARK